MSLMWVIIGNIHLLCFIRYNLGYFGHVGNKIVVYSTIYLFHSLDLLVFACWWSFKLLSLYIMCNKWNFCETPLGRLLGVPSLYHIPSGFTVTHGRSVRILCQCDTNCAGHFIVDAHASRHVACYCNVIQRWTGCTMLTCWLLNKIKMSR